MSDLIVHASRVPGLELELRTDTQYASAYLHGRPFATVRRRHAFDPPGSPSWQVWIGNDSIPFRCALANTALRHVERMARQAVAS